MSHAVGSVTRRDLLRSTLSGALVATLSGTAALRLPHPASTPAQSRTRSGSGGTSSPLRPRLGINLSGPADWNTELPFVDVFRMSRPWISQRRGADWGQGPELELDEFGWVKRLEPDCWAETPLCTISGGHYPSGSYTVLYDGSGRLEFWNAATVATRSPGRITLDVDASRGNFWLRIMETDPANPVRNIRVLMPGFADRTSEQPFHPRFLEYWQGVAAVRFMDWMHTNGSTITHWSERPTLKHATCSKHGVPVEHMIALANTLRADPWFCMPHLADDAYVRKFAQMVREQLRPELKVWIEYSNEVWNGQFAQHRHAAQRGQELGLAEKPWEAAWHYTAVRSCQLFAIWESVFEGAERLVRVLPSQAAVTHVSEQILNFQDASGRADVLAIAPYISCNVPRSGKELTTSVVEKWTVDQALDYMEQTALPQAVQRIRAQKGIADQHGLRLVAYEAGQHMVGVGGGENNETVTRLFHAANAHPRMGDIYRQYYEAWSDAGGDLLCHFSSISQWSKWGSWGLMQYADQDPADSPKFQATLDWARRCGQPVRRVSRTGNNSNFQQ